MHIDRRLLGWGIFFVLLGAIPLAVRADLLDEATVRQWPLLWPLLLIGWGLALLLRRTPFAVVGGTIGAVTFGLMGGGLIATGVGGIGPVGCSGNDVSTQAFSARTGTLDASGRFSIEFDCGRLDVATADGSDWRVEGSARDARAPEVTTDPASVTVRPADRARNFDVSRRNDWRITVPRTADLQTFNITLNAGEGVADLQGAHLGSANITLNAGTLTVDMSQAVALSQVNATVNAGAGKVGLPALTGSADMSVNAGSLDACVPTGVGVRVDFSGALGSQNLDALGLSKIDDRTWVSAGYDTAATKIQLRVSANAGSFSLHLGGGCGA